MAKSFRDLKVWNISMGLTLLVYALSAEFPKSEMYGLSAPMRRAAVSIASNVAEGSSHGTRKDFRPFVLVARGSNCELQTQLMIAAGLGYAQSERLAEAQAVCEEVARMLSGLSALLKLKPAPLTTKN